MTYDEIMNKLDYYIYNHTELVIWLTLALLAVIVVWWSINSISFRYTIGIIALMTALALWAIDRWYFSLL